MSVNGSSSRVTSAAGPNGPLTSIPPVPRRPTGSYTRTTRSPERSSASLTLDSTTPPDTRTSGANPCAPMRVRAPAFIRTPAAVAPSWSVPMTIPYRCVCTPWSVSGSGNRGARSRDSRTVVVTCPSTASRVVSNPWIESFTSATPKPGSDTST
ncbi:hypothetical protein QP157_18470 [Sphingomonas sp. LR61]